MKKIMKIMLFCCILSAVIYLGCNDYEHEKNPVGFVIYPLDSIHVLPGDTLLLDTIIIGDSAIIIYSTDSLP